MIMFLYWSLPMILLILGLFCFVSTRKHLLSMLLSWEFIVLMLSHLLFIYLNLMNYENYFSMMFIKFSLYNSNSW